MYNIFQPYDDEQLRALINIEPIYRSWMETERDRVELPYNLKWKTVKGRDYLYEVVDRVGNAKSLGPRSDETELAFREFRTQKDEVELRRSRMVPKLRQAARIYRAVRLPILTSESGRALRAADRLNLLGTNLIVTGPICILAYMIEAAGRIATTVIDTQQFDLAWSVDQREGNDRAGVVRSNLPFSPILAEPDWLLLGRFVDRILATRDGSAARVIAPDPRWFALHSIWRGDVERGYDLLDAVKSCMPQFPLDSKFEANIPAALKPSFTSWLNAGR